MRGRTTHKRAIEHTSLPSIGQNSTTIDVSERSLEYAPFKLASLVMPRYRTAFGLTRTTVWR